MDHKTWLWGNKSKEKTILTADKANVPTKCNEEEEIHTLLSDKVELENEIKNLKHKLSSVISEYDVKHQLVEKESKMAQEAAAGWEKAEAEAASLKEQLDEALQWRMANEGRITHLDAALKECMQQLRFVREEQEKRIHDAITKTSKEYEKSQMAVEENLEETRKKLAKVCAENASLSEALSIKEKVIEDLNKQRAQLESEFNALMIRLDSTEKENASLKYEVRVTEKEIEIRNEEREFNRRTAEASHKQHVESVKKIAKLETECQRLRLLVRKRLPGPAALSKMRNEVEMLGRESIELRRRKSSPGPTGPIMDSAIDTYPDAPSRKINMLIEQLYAMEEENKALKEALNKKTNELQFSRVLHARTTSKSSEIESQLEESTNGDANMERIRNSVMSRGFSLTSASDFGSDDKASCAESWASALILELDHFRNGKLRESPSCKTVGSSDMSLMDDFLEMEKLALTAVDKPSQNHACSEEANVTVSPLPLVSTEVTGREIVPVPDSHYELGSTKNEAESTNILNSGYPDWLQKILKLIFEQSHATHKCTSEILQDIRKALMITDLSNSEEVVDDMESVDYLSRLYPSRVNGSMSWKPSNVSSMDAPGVMADGCMSLPETSNQKLQPELSKSICRIIELIEGIQLQSSNNSIQQASNGGCFISNKHLEAPSGYLVRVFQWKTSELSDILQQLLHACYHLMNGKIDFAKFAQELAFTLDWIMNNCFSFQDVSSMRDTFKKHSDWDDPNESDAEVVSHFAESDTSGIAAPHGHNNFCQKDEVQLNSEENKELRDELTSIEAANKDLDLNNLSSIEMNGTLVNQLQESVNTTESEPLEKTVKVIQGEVQSHESVSKTEPNGSCEKLSLPEPESDNNSSGCEGLEPTCHDSELKKETTYLETKQEEIQLHTEWEITAASEKLAECQEAILNLGKQFKALASPTEAVLFDRVISTPCDTDNISATTSTKLKGKMTSQRSSLRDQMIAEDSAETKSHMPSKNKATDGPSNSTVGVAKSKCNDASSVIGAIEHLEKILLSSGSKRYIDDDAACKSLAIVPGKKQGVGSLWKKLLWRKRKGGSKKASLPFK